MQGKPVQIQPLNGTELMIVWEDGQMSLLPNTLVQLHCCCAKCVDEMTGKRLITEEDVSADARLLEVILVGNYGVRFRWSKGCESGIYPFELLKEISLEKINQN